MNDTHFTKYKLALTECLSPDKYRLEKRFHQIKQRISQKKPVDRMLPGFEASLERSHQAYLNKKALVPEIHLNEVLPVSNFADDIRELIKENQVTIICSETGSGKTTQIPQICLSIGLGIAGMIGHTQPRRIAARSVSSRIAEELNVTPGEQVGYQVRFTAQTSEKTLIKIMTDGILLAETRRDPLLLAYDAIIIDEAHERSLNIDFLLGYIKQILPSRPDLKIIITSATIDPQRFSRHFNNAPVMEVPGRTYPVDVIYRPAVDSNDESRLMHQSTAILHAIEECWLHGPGDILVFLPGERNIRDTTDTLVKAGLRNAEIVPLFARLSAKQQQQIFKKSNGFRIVLSTNVAETSLTVPGIRYVVDTGLARISRYSVRRKIQRLPVEAISKASANQRKGRCGRVAKGICIRLYSEEDFNTRPEFTQAEIQRTNLAAVILQMASLKLGNPRDFPFIDKPENRYINDGYRLLFELGAVDEENKLTKTGHLISHIPIDPRLARMLLAGHDNGCLHELLIITSGLSILDPKERPAEHREKARLAHEVFSDNKSDLYGYIKLWNYYRTEAAPLSQNQQRKFCKKHFLSWIRMREWRDTYQQLKKISDDLGWKIHAKSASEDVVHIALLTGLINQVALKEDKLNYTGPRNTKLQIFPASAVSKTRPKWIMCAAFIETSNLYGHEVAQINPSWIESVAPHLIKHNYSEPAWDRKTGQVRANHSMSLFGLVFMSGRKINFGTVDSVQSREIFIRDALVAGEIDTQARFFLNNRTLLSSIEALEDMSRRRDVLVSEQQLYDFYDNRLPATVRDAATLNRWLKTDINKKTATLSMLRDDLMRHDAEHINETRFPEKMITAAGEIELDYYFEPGHTHDGVCAKIPLAMLSTVSEKQFEWLVPGMLTDKIEQLIRSLPKSIRRKLIPAADYAKACEEALRDEKGDLYDCLSRTIHKMTGVSIENKDWHPEKLDEHYQMRFSIINDSADEIASGRSLAKLRDQLSVEVIDAVRERSGGEWQRSNITEWDVDELDQSVEIDKLTVFPAYVDQHESVSLKVFDTREEAITVHRKAVMRLVMLALSSQIKSIQRFIKKREGFLLKYAALSSNNQDVNDLVLQLQALIIEHACQLKDENIRSRQAFMHIVERGKRNLHRSQDQFIDVLEKILSETQQLRQLLSSDTATNRAVKVQLDELVYAGFMLDVPHNWLIQYPRYLVAMKQRLEKYKSNPNRDMQNEQLIQDLYQHWQKIQNKASPVTNKFEFKDFRWLLEELRISLFAQPMKTLMPVSVKRLQKMLMTFA